VTEVYLIVPVSLLLQRLRDDHEKDERRVAGWVRRGGIACEYYYEVRPNIKCICSTIRFHHTSCCSIGFGCNCCVVAWIWV